MLICMNTLMLLWLAKKHFIDPTVRNIYRKNFLIGDAGGQVQHFIEHQSAVSARLRCGQPSKSHIK